MNVHVESVFDCPPDRAWDEVQRTALLLEVCGPLVTFRAVEPAVLPPRWEEGITVRCRSYLFGVVPLGTRTVRIERIDQEARAIQTREQDPLFRRWDHLIRVRAADGGRTRYSDTVDLDAGPVTPLVRPCVHWFYRYRHLRWRRVAKRLAAAAVGAPTPR